MENKLIKYSRAGDAFHYRWAARRCLRMIHPKSQLKYVIIEGSRESKAAGEDVIDVAEYTESTKNGAQEVSYFQLKHSTKRVREFFNISDLKDTVKGFANRFRVHFCGDKKIQGYQTVKFLIVSNRPFSKNLKKGIFAIGNGQITTRRFQQTLKKYTRLNKEHLKKFCASLELVDGRGDYNVQRSELLSEISKFIAGSVDATKINNIIVFVSDPDNFGRRIVREDILAQFGVTSERDLFPAPLEFEKPTNIIKREQQEILIEHILKNSSPIIIRAEGGVGKSIVSRQLAESLPNGSLGIVYDCFGSGTYRNPSQPRHRTHQALVQVINEIAIKGLCDPLIPNSTYSDDALFRAFLNKLRMASLALQKANPDAVLVVLIDAADNAEIAAKEYGHSCFANQLLRVNIPQGCRIVMLCRTERVHLLNPASTVRLVELKPFNEAETLVHLRKYFPDASDNDGLEFFRLTNNGNPRVQANALSIKRSNKISDVLASLGPSGTTVDKQIEVQLNVAVSIVKDIYPSDFQQRIDAICLGLANLPPFVPVNVLAKAAEVKESDVKSFVSDLGRPLWLSDNFVQFRDEPTESWFRKNFSASAQQIESYVQRLKSLALSFSYVAKALPLLLLQSENYDELITLALSDDFLPQDSPIDKRNIQVYRLQFAFKAALKQKRYADAVKLALRAGEEVAGDNRQMELLTKNVDLIAPLQSEQRVQELARRRMLKGIWGGSENVYSASLLSSIDDFKGEARSYLRSAENWLGLYFEERKKNKNAKHDDRLKDEDIVELAFAYFNLFGPKKLVGFILSWQPPEVIFRIARLLVRRLVDAGKFTAIDKIAHFGRHNQYLMIAIADELLAIGKFPPVAPMRKCLDLLINKKDRITKLGFRWHDNTITTAIISFAEASSAIGLSRTKILRVLSYYIPKRASRSANNEYQDKERNPFLRAIALKVAISGNIEPDLKSLMPKEFLKKEKKYHNERNIEQFTRVIGGLLPWYMVRSRILIDAKENFDEMVQEACERSKKARSQGWREYDRIPFEISRVRFEILALNKVSSGSELKKFVENLSNKDGKYWLSDRLKALRAAYRLAHLSSIRHQLEQSCIKNVESASEEGPEVRSGWYIDIARAVLPRNKEDAAAYFNYAIEAVSKFGDEVLERWAAVIAIAKRCATGKRLSSELIYRFTRCAELVSEYVEDKHFDRDEVVEVCARLSPTSAFAFLSRWRDRDIGWFARQLSALAHETVSSKIISPSVGWSLSAFFDGSDHVDFAGLCIKNESEAIRRQYILDVAVRDLQLRNTSEVDWRKLADIAKKFSLKNIDLQKVLEFYTLRPSTEGGTIQIFGKDYEEEFKNVNWQKILGDLNLSTNTGVSKAISRFNIMSVPRYPEVFWEEVMKRVPENKASNFLRVITKTEQLDLYDARNILSCFPGNWRQKASVQRIWPNVILSIARRFAFKLTNHYILRSFLQDFPAEGEELSLICKGIIEGLSESSNVTGAGAFFGFCGIVSPFISPQEANELLNFAISRFEEHMDDGFADGPWANCLIPPEDTTDAFTGFVWAALGSPQSAIRWQAAHCVRRLAEAGCISEISALIEWMCRDCVNAFGYYKFPFYNYHARLYLLMAMARVAIDNPGVLKSNSSVFAQQALEGMPNVLIQKYATDIALSIETTFPGTYETNISERLRKVGVSQMPKIEINGYDNNLESPWHAKGEVAQNLELYLSYDFDRYWFPSLGEVFGISAKQVEDLAREIVLKEWHIQLDEKFIRDPRNNLWRSYRHERETWHDHFSYPRTDDYSFYLSYHAMLSVAAKLLQKMPIVHRKHYWSNIDAWFNWLERHILTHSNGRWLADRRDPAPLERRSWLKEEKTKDWRSKINPEDFLDGLLIERNGKTWLNICGSWDDNDSECGNNENYYISSALVSPETSQSLLNALTTCRNPHDFKLPNYKEEEMEFKQPPFELKGWIGKDSSCTRIDAFDPHAGEISYPPYTIGALFVEKFGLSVDQYQRKWCLSGTDKASLATEIWSLKRRRRTEREEFFRSGNRINVSLEFLKKFCSTLGCELIIKVEIQRQVHRSYYTRSDDGNKYTPPHFKIYIFSADGILKDTKTKYQIR